MILSALVLAVVAVTSTEVVPSVTEFAAVAVEAFTTPPASVVRIDTNPPVTETPPIVQANVTLPFG